MTTEEKINQLEAAFKAQIDELRKEVKPKFEVGKWYKRPHNKALLFATADKGNGWYSGYGFDNSGYWMSSPSPQWTLCGEIPATDKEVEEALIKEAERRGFKEGVTFKPVVENVDKVGKVTDRIIFFPKRLYGYEQGLASGKNWIFYQGKWAEIIKDEPIKVGRYAVEKDGDSYKIGCKEIDSWRIESLRVLMKQQGFKKIAFDGIEVDLETIEKILKM